MESGAEAVGSRGTLDGAVHVSDLRCGKLATETGSDIRAAWKISLMKTRLCGLSVLLTSKQEAEVQTDEMFTLC